MNRLDQVRQQREAILCLASTYGIYILGEEAVAALRKAGIQFTELSRERKTIEDDVRTL
jgi:hypothetical protein